MDSQRTLPILAICAGVAVLAAHGIRRTCS